MFGTYAVTKGLQSALTAIFPPACIGCNGPVASDFGLCGACWPQTPFIVGLTCDKCGTPLPGEDEGRPEFCDDCLTIARPWARGRAVFTYNDVARKMVLSLKHGDRLDLVRPMGQWLARAALQISEPGMLLAPIPLHWSRLLRRRYNQSALLSRATAKISGHGHCPDLLVRARNTPSQEGLNRDQRFANLAECIRVHPHRKGLVEGRHVLLVDDVMTSGATFAVAADACLAAGAAQVSVIALARVAKDA
ncbi:MAG: ComF family protein [Albidovulum sp.]